MRQTDRFLTSGSQLITKHRDHMTGSYVCSLVINTSIICYRAVEFKSCAIKLIGTTETGCWSNSQWRLRQMMMWAVGLISVPWDVGWFICITFLSRCFCRVVAVWAPSLCGLLGMEAGRRTAATVTAIQTAFTPYPSAAPPRMATSPGTARPAPPPWPPPTAQGTSMRSR